MRWPFVTRRRYEEMKARKDGAYEERNRTVAALAGAAIQLGGCAGVARTAIPGWSDDWHGCIYVELPGAGQLAWHYHDSQAHLFEGFPAYTKPWDGHTTPTKYERLDGFARLARGSVPG